MARPKTARIRQFIIDQVGEHPRDIVSVTAARFQISRQAVQRHINDLVECDAIAAEGKTRSRRYWLRPIADFDFRVELDGKVEEHITWGEHVRPKLAEKVPSNVLQITEYGFTEMLNNVIDHSNASHSDIHVTFTPESISIRIHDNGVGIFTKIKKALNLPDEVAAIWELSKGKLTTDPDNHTGEGVFFTSRMFDFFCIMSGTLCFIHTRDEDDWLIEDRTDCLEGTYVRMNVLLSTKLTCADLFNNFADPEKFDYSFAKTHVPISLLQYGQENLVSRSQARRVINRFDRFQEVILDFGGVDFVGQAFADEIFRVFQLKHPEISLIPINTCEPVARMIHHAIANLREHEDQ